MKTKVTLSVSVFLICVLTGVVFASRDNPAVRGSGPDTFGGKESALESDCGCPDIASTELFRTKGLEYTNSKEFAEAVVAVANGSSRYSPEEIPASWRTVAAEWRAYVKAHPAGSSHTGSLTASLPGADKTMFLKTRDSCAPTLLYLSSLEYRSRMGNDKLRPVFPQVVRASTRDLDARIAEKRQMDPIFAKRAAEIGARIAEAERLGMGECAPGAIVRAKMELERARHEAAEIRTGVRETEALFANVAGYSDTLLQRQQFASRKGIRCYQD